MIIDRHSTMHICSKLTVGISLSLAVIAPAIAQTPLAATPGPIEQLKPGGFLWAPEVAPLGPVTVIISLKTQRAYAYRNGVPIGVSTVSTGKRGHATPTGVFTILQKQVEHKSNLYDDAPMPFMQRLTWSGIAMHAGHLPGYPASHGCVRLPREFAEKLYAITRLGLTVVITGDAVVPEVVTTPGILAAAPDDAHSAPGTFSWTPERSPTGPVSIVVSGRDRRVIVLRNGVEIGSADIVIDGPVVNTEAFTLRAIDESGFHWLRLPLPGRVTTVAGDMTSDERARAHLPEAFRRDLDTVLTPGATLLITRDSLAGGGTGKRLTVLESVRAKKSRPVTK